MKEPLNLGRCLSFINSQLRLNEHGDSQEKMRWRAVTLSRQTGTGGHLVAEELAMYLQLLGGENAGPWMVFDRNLLERVLEEHNLPARLAKFMPEDRISHIEDMLDELFGLHPPTWTLVEKTSDTILRLAELGNVIILGRGANVITSKLDNVFHARLVGSLEARTQYVEADRKLDRKAAEELILHEDEGRRRYVRKYFHRDVDDPALFHVAINTPAVGHAAAAKLIMQAMYPTLETAHALSPRHD
ncbi:MAG TPA: cytidylate kinase-like family protein [Candidatus Angelobacter sp.]|nr:cytidylate kinase-like family protein [Candidatus Angelobacter sp.]